MERPHGHIRMEVLLIPDDPRDQAIIRLLRKVAPRRRVSKLKHLAYEGILARQGLLPGHPPMTERTPDHPGPIEPDRPPLQHESARTLQQPASVDETPMFVDPLEFLETIARQADKFATQSWDGR
jgi:hypothetical protein